MIRKFLSVALAAWIALLAGCHTMQGLGEDIERAGEKIQDKAKK